VVLLVACLQEYNQHIQDLKEEMEEATKSAQVIREEIQAFRNRYTLLLTRTRYRDCLFTSCTILATVGSS
jgi:chromosome segregation ATPase